MPKKIIYSLIFIFAIIVVAKFVLTRNHQSNEPSELPVPTVKEKQYPDKNLLGQEKSPYLLQHKDNPVHWYPWGDAAFAKAKAENKPVFLSIGYSTCHWCHVMEHESFENAELADILNQYFVAIKVDREERPDIDNIYMKTVMALTGGGGWPLSVFLTPERKPFYGGTYFPPEARWGQPGFKDLLLSIHNGWVNQHEEVLQSSQSITEALQNSSASAKTEGAVVLDKEIFANAFRYYSGNFDSRYGGFGTAPKFPSTHNLSFLLRYWKRTNDPKALEIVEKTLTEMAKGGMYDHLGGGFHRYSTDQKWQVPHFEKMLYDQAIIAQTYLEAYQITKKEEYARVAREIFDYVLRDMTDKNGGFYSAEDADSLESKDSHEKKEGAFYVWEYKTIVNLLGPDAEIFNYYYGIEENGNAENDPHGEFTGKNILFAAHSLEETAKQFKKSAKEIADVLARSESKLLTARAQRPRPHLDDKILVDWNGLMISTLAFGSMVLNEPKYQQAAESATRFILTTLIKEDGRLLHRYRDGEAAILGSIEDYAFFVHGLIDLYQATFKVEYLKEAKRLTEDMIKLFGEKDKGGFFFTASDAERLLFREKEIYDGAIPSGNAFAALDLLRLGRLTLNPEWENKAEALFQAFGNELKQSPAVYSQSLIALDFAFGPSKEIVIVGDKESKETQEMLRALYGRYLPNKVVILKPSDNKEAQELISVIPFVESQPAFEGKATAYVCENYQCNFPVTDINKFEELLR